MATAKASPSGAHLDDICHSLLFELGWMVLVRVVRVVRPPAFSTELEKKLDQGALGMSDPCGTLQLALKPNSVPRNNCLLTNFYFCAN